jgi:protein TonB
VPDDNRDVHLQRLLAPAELDRPWYFTFARNLYEFFRPPKLPPLELTSRPVEVTDIWGLYGRKKKSFLLSTGFQVCVVLLLATVFSSKTVQQTIQRGAVIFVPTADTAPPEIRLSARKGGGSGGDRSPLPASKGRLPKAALKQFTPPAAVYNNMNPKLTIEASIVAPPDVNLPQVNMTEYGDPMGKLGPKSNGPGSGGGIGSKKGGGVGDGDGPGAGPGEGPGISDGVFYAGRGGVTNPVPTYRPDPEYSDEARKARWQGTVLLELVVDEKGMPRDIHIKQSLGLGLDEEAVKTVAKWRFKPGTKDGKPVAVMATISVGFHLL